MLTYTDIENSIEEYASTLPHGIEDLTKPHTITGLLMALSRQYIRPNKQEILYNNYDYLQETIDIYMDLIYRYSNNTYPIIEEYCLFIDINRDTYYTWLKNENNINHKWDINNIELFNKGLRKSNLTRADILKKVQEMSREGRLKSASTGNVGGIFLCKAIDGLTETAPTVKVQQIASTPINQLPQFGNMQQNDIYLIDGNEK